MYNLLLEIVLLLVCLGRSLRRKLVELATTVFGVHGLLSIFGIRRIKEKIQFNNNRPNVADITILTCTAYLLILLYTKPLLNP